MSKPETRKQRWTLIALVAVFFVPLLVAVILNSRWVDWKPQAEVNHGELLSPVVPLPEPLRRTLAAERQWVLIDACRRDCAQRADLLGRMDRALGRRSDQFTPTLALGETLADDAIPPGVTTVEYEPWSAYLGTALSDADSVYLVDPLGNVMMRYDGQFEASEVVEDVERLIKYSRFQ